VKILVLGATGATGRQVVRVALARHSVSAFVRGQADPPFDERVQMVPGDAYTPESIHAAVAGHDAIISCLGAALSHSFGERSRPGATAAAPLVEAMSSAGMRRLIVVSAMGAVDRNAVSPLFRAGIATLLRGIFADKDAMEPVISGSTLDWTIVRAANLNHGPEGPVDDAPELPLSATAFVSRAALAGYLVRILDDATKFRQIVYLKSRR